MELNNCYYIPSMGRNILSPSCLMRDGYSFASTNNGCVISKNAMFVADAPIVNGLFILNLEMHLFTMLVLKGFGLMICVLPIYGIVVWGI